MRKIFLAAVLILTATIFNVANAAADFNSINWDNVQRVNNKEDFFRYIRDCENRLQSDIAVVFSNGFFVDTNECLKMLQSPSVEVTYSTNQQSNVTRALYKINIYPGAKVAYAYSTGNTSILNAEEKQLFNVAVQVVNEANKRPNDLMKEYYIHEFITDRVSYYTAPQTNVLERHHTAVGALIDGRANCQGYTDAFYMLGKMLRLNVGKVRGTAKGEGHAWNTITFGDGRIYAVDVTWDDPSFGNSDGYHNYIYFNAPLEILQTTHNWNRAYNPSIYPKIDGRYFFCSQTLLDNKGKHIAIRANSAETALYYIAQRISQEGYSMCWAMAPYDSKYADLNFSLNRLVREILPKQYNWYGSATMSVTRRGNYIFYVVSANKK